MECKVKGYRGAAKYHWVKENGPVPDGCELHHTCSNGYCVTLSHIEVQTIANHKKIHRPKAVHGYSRYANHGCRCDACKEDWARYYRERRLRGVP